MADQKLIDQVDAMFTYHPPFGSQPARYDRIRAQARELATLLIHNCPASRELSAALTLLQQATQMANAAIACNEVNIG